VRDYAIFILDPAGHVSTWNSGAERIKGYTAQQIIGKHFSVFYPLDVAASGKCDLELELAAREGRFEDEGWRLRRDGSRLWASVVITALRSPEGDLVGFAKVTRDLTQRKATEDAERLLAAERAALMEKERIHSFQERFLAILGHDLRNPLASLSIGVGILREQAGTSTMSLTLERMDSSARRMSRMVEQLLDFTRIRLSGDLQLTLSAMDLCDTLDDIVAELRVAHPARIIRLSRQAAFGRWDRDRLEQVFSNLIGNALLYSEANTPVSVTLRAQPEQVEIEVHNEGPAIPPALLTTLFNPFRRGERDSRSAKTAGLGLGLYISHQLVVAHRGTLDVRSDAVSGTSFRVTLPRAVADYPSE
jgi:hypothetical protein